MDQDMRPFARGGRNQGRGSGSSAEISPLTRVTNALQQNNAHVSMKRDQDMRRMFKKKKRRNKPGFRERASFNSASQTSHRDLDRPKDDPNLYKTHIHQSEINISKTLQGTFDMVEKTLRFNFNYTGSLSSKAAVTANKMRDLQTCLDHELFSIGSNTAVTPAQELRVLDSLCQFFDEHNDKDVKTRYTYFETIFLGREGESAPHEVRIGLLSQLCVLAIQYPGCEGLLSDVVTWLNRVAFANNYARSFVSMWEEEFCCYQENDDSFDESSLEKNGLEDYLKPIIHTSPGICPYFMALTMETYNFSEIPPLPTLDVLSDWLNESAKSVITPLISQSMEHLRQLLIEAFQKLVVLAAVESYFVNDTLSMEQPKLFSKLQLGLLKFLMSVQAEGSEGSFANNPIVTDSFIEKLLETLSGRLAKIPDIRQSLSQDSVRTRRQSTGPFSPPPTASSQSDLTFFQNCEESQSAENLKLDVTKESLDRIGQICSVAIATGTWKGEKEKIADCGQKMGLPLEDSMLGSL